MSIDPGSLDVRATFERPVTDTSNPDGQIIRRWQTACEMWSALRYLRGGEAVMQARLVSRTPAILTIRSTAAALAVTSEWRVSVRDRTGRRRSFELREDPRPADQSGYLEMLVEAVG